MTLKDTVLKYYSQFTDLCDKNFKFAEYLGPTIVKEMSEKTLSKRTSDVIYRMQFGNEKGLTVFDMIVVGEFATRVMNAVAEKKNTEEYNTYRLDKVRTVSRLIQIALRGSNRYREGSYEALIYNAIMSILNSTMMNISMSLNRTKEDEKRDQMVLDSMDFHGFSKSFMNDVSSVNAECAYDDDNANHPYNIHKTIIALFGLNYTFYSVLDPKQSTEMDAYGKSIEVHPYTWDEFVNKVSELMGNNVGNDTLYRILAYYDCVCLGNKAQIEFLKKFASGSLIDKAFTDIMDAENVANESMTVDQFICGFIDTE